MIREFVGENDTMPPAPAGYVHAFGGAKPLEMNSNLKGAEPYSGERFPRSEWKELMELQEAEQSSPWHHWKGAGIDVKDQKNSSWCWCFGTIGAIQTRYAQQGMGNTNLSAASVAGPVVNYNKDRGGWGEWALEYISENGVATTDVWPELSADRTLDSDIAVKESRFKHDVPCFQAHPQRDLDSIVSSLLDPVNPCPVTLGYSWWRHLVFGTRATFTDGVITLWIVNSWGADWNGDGTVKLIGEQKCAADESITICGVTPIKHNKEN